MAGCETVSGEAMATFAGDVVVVTGAAMGIGEATAMGFAALGAKVACLDLDEAAAKQTAERAMAVHAGCVAMGLACDVADEAAGCGALERVVEAFGGLHVLINNAGITRDRTALKLASGDFRAVLDVNLTGTFLMAQAAATFMKTQRYGRIINTSSINARGKFGQANYAASKAGVIGLTRTLAIEWARYGITVNAVAPGFVRTAMTAAIPEPVKDEAITKIPVGRIAEAEEIARVHRFFADRHSAYITGQVLVVDGGRTLV